jgi:hypothetical protein
MEEQHIARPRWILPEMGYQFVDVGEATIATVQGPVDRSPSTQGEPEAEEGPESPLRGAERASPKPVVTPQNPVGSPHLPPLTQAPQTPEMLMGQGVIPDKMLIGHDGIHGIRKTLGSGPDEEEGRRDLMAAQDVE